MGSAGHIARKRFGQHFLKDSGVIADILAALGVQVGDAFLEVGPGLGALTHPLAVALQKSGGSLSAIEIDRDLAARWRGRADLQLIEGDALTFDYRAHSIARAVPGRLRLCGNLPYNIATPLLLLLARQADAWRDAHFMLQKEVAERCAASSGAAYGRLSVMLQWRLEMQLLFNVPPTAFTPAPKVTSSVLRLRPKPIQPDVALEPHLSELLAAAFSRRRQLLRHSLLPWLAERGISAESFELRRRAEEVPPEEFIALAERVAAR